MARTPLAALTFALILPGLALAQVPATQAVTQEATRQGVAATTQAIQQQTQDAAAARDAKKAAEPAPKTKESPAEAAPQKPGQ